MGESNLQYLLIIGNGFDRAHGLRTTYSDILDFICSSLHNSSITGLSEDKTLKMKSKYDSKKIIQELDKKFSDSIYSLHENVNVKKKENDLKKLFIEKFRNKMIYTSL